MINLTVTEFASLGGKFRAKKLSKKTSARNRYAGRTGAA
jgi:hypothetical protein